MVDFLSCPPIGSLKLNFDVAEISSFMVVNIVITDHEEIILFAVVRRFLFLNVNAKEANAVLLAVKTAVNLFSSSKILLEGDYLVTIFALNNHCFKC